MAQKTHCDYCNTVIENEQYNLNLVLLKIKEVKEIGAASKTQEEVLLKKYCTDICDYCQMQVQHFFNHLGQGMAMKEAEEQGL